MQRSGVQRVGRAAMRAGYLRKQTVLPVLQYSTAVREAQLAALIALVGPYGTFELRSGAMPINTSTADSGRLLCELVLPETWAKVANGALVSQGTWQGLSIGEGTAGYWRLRSQDGKAHAQGTVGGVGTGAALEINDTYFEAQLVFRLEDFGIHAGNA